MVGGWKIYWGSPKVSQLGACLNAWLEVFWPHCGIKFCSLIAVHWCDLKYFYFCIKKSISIFKKIRGIVRSCLVGGYLTASLEQIFQTTKNLNSLEVALLHWTRGPMRPWGVVRCVANSNASPQKRALVGEKSSIMFKYWWWLSYEEEEVHIVCLNEHGHNVKKTQSVSSFLQSAHKLTTTAPLTEEKAVKWRKEHALLGRWYLFLYDKKVN